MNNWKTTFCGIATGAIALLTALVAIFDQDPATNPDWTMVTTTLCAALALIMARDPQKKPPSENP